MHTSVDTCVTYVRGASGMPHAASAADEAMKSSFVCAFTCVLKLFIYEY